MLSDLLQDWVLQNDPPAYVFEKPVYDFSCLASTSAAKRGTAGRQSCSIVWNTRIVSKAQASDLSHFDVIDKSLSSDTIFSSEDN